MAPQAGAQLNVRWTISGLVSLIGVGALVLGVFYQQYGLVAGLALVFLAESLFWRWKFLHRLVPSVFLHEQKRSRIKTWLLLYEKADDSSEKLLLFQINQAQEENLSLAEKRVIDGLRALVELRKLAFGKPSSSSQALLEAFVFHGEREQTGLHYAQQSESYSPDFSVAEIADAATLVASLYWKVFQSATEQGSRISKPARQLLEGLFGKAFVQAELEREIEILTDCMQRQGGIPFLMLNLIRRQHWGWAKPLGQRLLTSDIAIEEEVRACLYWMTEIQWFTHEAISVPDYETTIRYLYHLCFLNPERAGFLEIDSQFFSQFDTINELAREGFLFKETLIDKILALWGEQNRLFDSIFKEVLQSLTRQKNKIYQDRASWIRFWDREKEAFEKEYLFLLEGNLCYFQKDFEGAREFYEKAIEASPSLRPALLNRVFAYAKLADKRHHEAAVEELLTMKSLHPISLSVIGNSFLLLGEDEEAEVFYRQLRKVEGWGRKTDYYKSTFCFENGLLEKALHYGQKAYESNPDDASVSFHFSQCLNAVGDKKAALEILRKIGSGGPQWLNYYRFTLERDSGQWGEAHQTLLQIPPEYFDDPEELEAAMDFAKDTSDLNLLRRLRARR